MITTEQPTLETEGLILRPFSFADAARVQELAGDEKVAATTLRIPHPYEDGMAEAWIATHADSWSEERAAIFAIVPADEGSLVGSIGLELEPQDERAEVGYWIGKPYWNRGYGTEAVRAALGFAFDELGLNRVQAQVLPGNPASTKVLIKAGFRREGRLRQYVTKRGKLEDVEMYSILASEYHERRAR